MPTASEYFNEVLLYIENAVSRQRLTSVAYNTWIRRLEPVRFEGDTFTLAVIDDKSGWAKSVIASRYGSLLDEAFEKVIGERVKVELFSSDKLGNPLEEAPEGDTMSPEGTSSHSSPGKGNYEFTFDTFIVGRSNEFANAACLGVANNPGGMYNPLFIHGPSGLGKTHLMHAISNRILEKDPKANIIYVTGEMFTYELIDAIQKQDTVNFKKKYRNADVLLVDDIQFISGKESTQEEFFHTFNELYSHGKQIVLTSDRPPKDIKTLEDRIRSRFESGLMADIGMPEYETRVAIIKRKAELLDLTLDESTVSYLADKLKTNVRQLEGAVKKLSALQNLLNTPPSIAQAQNVIREILSFEETPALTADVIINHVAAAYAVAPEDIRSRSRSKKISAARKAAAYVMKEMTPLSLQAIGSELGGKDHATVSFYINDMTKQTESDPVTREMLEDITKNLKGGE